MGKLEYILSRLADLGLILMIYLGSYSFYFWAKGNFNLNIQVLFAFWPDSNFAISVVNAGIFYFFLWKFDKVNAIAWFLFYDATFQYTLSTKALVDITTVMFFFVSCSLFYLTGIKIQRWYYLIFGWCLLTVFTGFYGSYFPLQAAWAITILYVVFKTRQNQLYIRKDLLKAAYSAGENISK